MGLQSRLRALDDFADRRSGGALSRKTTPQSARKIQLITVAVVALIFAVVDVAAGAAWPSALLISAGAITGFALGIGIVAKKRQTGTRT